MTPPILETLDQLLTREHDAVEAWLEAEGAAAPPLITTSVDLRHAGFKLAPVDTNLFPAGFHLLSPAASLRAARAFQRYVALFYPGASRLLLIPENHTRNRIYWDNVHALTSMLEAAGFTVRVGSLTALETDPGNQILSASGHPVSVLPLVRHENTLQLQDGFEPEIILLNNDLSIGYPEILQGVSQPVLPAPELGWWQRRKSTHFTHYNDLAARFAAQFNIDPWRITPLFARCGAVNFRDAGSLTNVAETADALLARLRERYAEHGIDREPYLFVKADGGTYGMGIMTVHKGEELLTLNKKNRNKMNVIKEGMVNDEVIIQEGIPTIDAVEGNPAEPLLYLAGGIPVGGAFRVNTARTAEGNLNAEGMYFTGMCDDSEKSGLKHVPVSGCNFRVYGLIARLAALAAGREAQECEKTIPHEGRTFQNLWASDSAAS